MLELLDYVETRLRILPGVIQASRQSDTGALEEMGFNLQRRLRQLKTLLQELEGKVDMAFEGQYSYIIRLDIGGMMNLRP